MEEIDKLQLKNALRLLCGGYMFDGSGSIEDIPAILTEMANDYQEIIDKQISTE